MGLGQATDPTGCPARGSRETASCPATPATACVTSRQHRFWVRISTSLLVGLCLLSAVSAATDDRPRIALVLGGGGARGLAHIGVLEWLEENRIPVDLVIGTSMGGLVGGAYALGWQPDEIHGLVLSLDWEEIFSPSPPFRNQNFRRKEDSTVYTTEFELGWQGGFKAPTGLNAGHFIGLLFDRMVVPYYAAEDFDDLPTPFRCVATDLETGEGVVLTEGPLSRALRATMAIPGVFTAVEHEGRLLVDGGILNNVPADLARTLGADFVIAVDVGSPLRDREELQTILGVVDQTINIMILENVRRTARHADIFLSPELEEFGSLDFGRVDEMIEKGRAAAEGRRQLLETVSVSPERYQVYLQQRYARKITTLPTLREVGVEGARSRQAQRIARSMRPYLSENLPLAELEETLTGIYGEGRTYAIGYRVEEQPGGNEKLLVSVEEKRYGPPFIRFGVNIDGSDVDDVNFVLRSRTTFFDLGRPGSEARFDVDLGSPLGVRTEYYLPISRRWFVAPSAFGYRRLTDLFSEDRRVAEYREVETGLRLDLGHGFGSIHDEFRFGYEIRRYDTDIRVGDPIVPEAEDTLASLGAAWRHNSLDRPNVPHRGLRWSVSQHHFFSRLGSSKDFDRLYAEADAFFPASRQSTLFVRAELGTHFGETVPLLQTFRLGGPLRLGAYGQGRLRGSHLVFLSGGYLRQIGRSSLMFGSRTFLAGWYEGGSTWNPGEDTRFLHVVSTGVVLDSVLGPLFFGGSWGDGGRFRVYFSVGFLF